jgi:hypothetical protein
MTALLRNPGTPRVSTTADPEPAVAVSRNPTLLKEVTVLHLRHLAAAINGIAPAGSGFGTRARSTAYSTAPPARVVLIAAQGANRKRGNPLAGYFAFTEVLVWLALEPLWD